MFRNAHSFDQDLSEWVKTAEISTLNLLLSPSSSERRIFVQNNHRDDNQKRRYVIIEKTDWI